MGTLKSIVFLPSRDQVGTDSVDVVHSFPVPRRPLFAGALQVDCGWEFHPKHRRWRISLHATTGVFQRFTNVSDVVWGTRGVLKQTKKIQCVFLKCVMSPEPYHIMSLLNCEQQKTLMSPKSMGY